MRTHIKDVKEKPKPTSKYLKEKPTSKHFKAKITPLVSVLFGSKAHSLRSKSGSKENTLKGNI